MERKRVVKLEDYDDRNITWNEWVEIVNLFGSQAQESLARVDVEYVMYSAARRRIYLRWKNKPLFPFRGFNKEFRGTAEHAAEVVFGHRIKLRIPNEWELEYKCFECESPYAIEHHHVVPRIRGGERTVPLCDQCHHVITSDQNLSREGKALFAEIDRRVIGDEKFMDKICQRHGGRFMTDDKLERITNALVMYSREIESKAMIGGYRGAHSMYRRKIRDLIRTIPLPTTRSYTHAEKLEQTSALQRKVEAA